MPTLGARVILSDDKDFIIFPLPMKFPDSVRISCLSGVGVFTDGSGRYRSGARLAIVGVGFLLANCTLATVSSRLQHCCRRHGGGRWRSRYLAVMIR